jgi:PAS domain S-box-containing protein
MSGPLRLQFPVSTFSPGSISRKLALLVLLAVLPALLILLSSGMEQRRQSVEQARHDVLLLTRSMAGAQKEIAGSVRQVLSTLSLLPEIQALDIQAAGMIIRAVLEKNPDYLNIALTDLNGDVVVSGKPFTGANLADRKHFREALSRKDFAVGEYIVSRVGTRVPAFAYAYPVLDKKGMPIAVLTTVIKLDRFASFHDTSTLPVKSFIAVTDHKGIRLFYYSAREKTNPVGTPIKAGSWERARGKKDPGIFTGTGSDGVRRIFAFEPIRLAPGEKPYLYVWAAIPEEHILKPVNAALARNLLLMLLASLMSLFIIWTIGKKTLLLPIRNLVSMTRQFADGKLDVCDRSSCTSGELGMLTESFCDMADALTMSQKSLRENEARFRLVMDSLDALVYVADMETYELLFINRYGRKLFGNITGRICWQALQAEQAGPCSFCTNKYLVDSSGNIGDVYTWEFQNTVNDHWYYIKDRAITWIDGRIVRLEVATDITVRKLAEAKLSEETERLAVTLRSIGDGVITTDAQGKVVLINRVAETLTGWNSREAQGRPLAEVFRITSGKTRQSIDSLMEKILSSREIAGLADDTVLISTSGQKRNIADSGAPIRDEKGKIIGLVLVFRDITRQLRTDQELSKVKKLESIGVLAGGIAHDFNNILAAILGNIDLSLMDTQISGTTRELLREAVKASRRARDLTQQLLTFAKGGEPIKQAASLAEIIRDSADFVLRGDRVSCHYVFPDDLWLVDIDKGQVSQVVQNIILNASNAMPDGGVIEVSCENMGAGMSADLGLPQDMDFVKMCIQDCGVGIPANVLNNIFDPYFSTKQEGSGLGLAITHSIVKKHGGSISVESTPGVGTTFTVYLPASQQQSLSVAREEEQGEGPGQLRILVMDDDEQVRNITRAMLEQMGHEVVLAGNSEAALRLYEKAVADGSPMDLVIMDLTVPGGMGGREAVQEILSINPKAKVVVASGYSNDPVMANFKKYGFRAAIAKPFQFTELGRVISQLVD